jgi:hypothetical protein
VTTRRALDGPAVEDGGRPPRRLGTITFTRKPPVAEPWSRRCQSPSAKQTVPLYAELPAGRSNERLSSRLPLMKNGSLPATTFAPPLRLQLVAPLSNPPLKSRASYAKSPQRANARVASGSQYPAEPVVIRPALAVA